MATSTCDPGKVASMDAWCRGPSQRSPLAHHPLASTHLEQPDRLISRAAHVPQVQQGGILEPHAIPAGHQSGRSKHGGQRWQRQLRSIVKLLRCLCCWRRCSWCRSCCRCRCCWGRGCCWGCCRGLRAAGAAERAHVPWAALHCTRGCVAMACTGSARSLPIPTPNQGPAAGGTGLPAGARWQARRAHLCELR